jgi:hypothetical protein
MAIERTAGAADEHANGVKFVVMMRQPSLAARCPNPFRIPNDRICAQQNGLLNLLD